jgi:hypothetical protein
MVWVLLTAEKDRISGARFLHYIQFANDNSTMMQLYVDHFYVQDNGVRRRMEATQLAFLAQLGKLQHLSLQLPIHGFPQSIWMLPVLRSLVLKGVTYMILPDEFAQLSLLTRLELIDCGLQRMPAVICKCQGVPLLYIRK